MLKKIMDLFAGAREKKKAVFFALIVLVAIMLILYVFNGLFFGGSENFIRLYNWADFSKYQAVFLSNGQVYFGKVTDANTQTLVMEDIYYLRSAANLQISESKSPDSTAETDNFALVKLGNEIHGPEDRMSINLSHVLFVENLKPDSKVVEAIMAYESKK